MNHRRRGSVYIVVLGMTMLVTVMGMGALLTTRLANKEANNSTDWQEAGTLAQAAIEDAMSYLNAQITASPSTWRASFTNYVHGGTPPMSGSLGRGTWSWQVYDAINSSFATDYQAPFRIYGIGKVGSATRVYSVQVVPGGTALDVLRCSMHTGGTDTTNGSIVLGAGPLSSNGKIITSAKIYGSIEAASQNGSGSNVTGTTTVPAATKTMPSSAVYNLYLAKATTIPWGSGTTATVSSGLISPTSTPWGLTNPDGIYSITAPSGSTITLNSLRIVGTLVISMSNGTLNITGPIAWQPNRVDYPILIVTGSNNTINIQGSNTWLSEATVNADLNGNGTKTDDILPVYRGVMHFIGSTNSIQVYNNAYMVGSIIADGTVTTNTQTTLISDPTLTTRPPFGYGTGTLVMVPGSWLWDSPL